MRVLEKIRDDRMIDVDALQRATRERERNSGRTRSECVEIEGRRSQDARYRLGQWPRLRVGQVLVVIAFGADETWTS